MLNVKHIYDNNLFLEMIRINKLVLCPRHVRNRQKNKLTKKKIKKKANYASRKEHAQLLFMLFLKLSLMVLYRKSTIKQ